MTKIFNIAEVTPEEMLEPVDTLNTIIEQLNDADIPDGPGGESYTLPVATSTTLGGIKAGEGLTVAADGTASVDVPEPAEPLSFSGGLAESDGTVTAVLGAGLSLVNGAITALGGGEGGGGGDYVLPVATADALGGVKVATSGPITIGLDGTLGLVDNIIPTASDTILGGIKVGEGLTIDDSGVLSADAEGSEYVLPVASADELGGVKVASAGPITIGEDGTLGVSDDIIPTASTTVLGGVKAPVNNFPAAGTPASLEIAEDGTINAHIATAHTAGVLKIAGQGMDIYATSYNPVYMDRDQNQAQEISPFFVESDAPWDGEGSGGRLTMVTSPSFMHDTITYTDSRTNESVTRTALGLTPASIAVLGGVKVTNEGGLMMNDGVLSANLDPDTMILKNGKISAVGGGGGGSSLKSVCSFYRGQTSLAQFLDMWGISIATDPTNLTEIWLLTKQQTGFSTGAACTVWQTDDDVYVQITKMYFGGSVTVSSNNVWLLGWRNVLTGEIGYYDLVDRSNYSAATALEPAGGVTFIPTNALTGLYATIFYESSVQAYGFKPVLNTSNSFYFANGAVFKKQK